MSLSATKKSEIIDEYKQSDSDTGSSQVQVALITAQIEALSGHFKEHIHDHHSRQGLLRMINRRRKLLDYLKRKNTDAYRDLIAKLGLRK